MKTTELPSLPLDAWEATKNTLHLYLQIVGKIRLGAMPRKNHWWNITLYVNNRGLTTRGIPYADGTEKVEVQFDFLDHRVEVLSSSGERHVIPLQEGLSVSEFYARLRQAFVDLSIPVELLAKPYDLPETRPFAEITDVSSYQPEYVQRFWRILMWIDAVFNEFSGRYYGKTCPVHLYWHHMDLAVTRFSGRKGPDLAPDMRISDKDAYSHEVISFGFWAGDEDVREPAFYAYAYPSPEGLDQQPLQPEAAQWIDSNGSPMAFLTYEAIRTTDDPRAALLSFLESAYQAAAPLAGWDVAGLQVPDLEDL